MAIHPKNRHNRLTIVRLPCGAARSIACASPAEPSCKSGAAALGRARGGALGGLAAARPALAQDARDWKHGLSLFGDLKYPAGFKHFDYVNAERAEGRRRRA